MTVHVDQGRRRRAGSDAAGRRELRSGHRHPDDPDGRRRHVRDRAWSATTQSEVGDYKYTVPENAQHEHDIHAGPETLAESVSAAFNTVGEWTIVVRQQRHHGVRAQRQPGYQGRSTSTDGGSPDYRGIGVRTSQGDEIEVDRGGNERPAAQPAERHQQHRADHRRAVRRHAVRQRPPGNPRSGRSSTTASRSVPARSWATTTAWSRSTSTAWCRSTASS